MGRYTLLKCKMDVTNEDLFARLSGTLLDVLWHPGWERGLGQSGSKSMCGCSPEATGTLVVNGLVPSAN